MDIFIGCYAQSQGQRVRPSIPHPPDPSSGMDVVNFYRGETGVLFHSRKRCQEIVQAGQFRLDRHLAGTLFVVRDHAGTHKDDEEVRRAPRNIWLCCGYNGEPVIEPH